MWNTYYDQPFVETDKLSPISTTNKASAGYCRFYTLLCIMIILSAGILTIGVSFGIIYAGPVVLVGDAVQYDIHNKVVVPMLPVIAGDIPPTIIKESSTTERLRFNAVVSVTLRNRGSIGLHYHADNILPFFTPVRHRITSIKGDNGTLGEALKFNASSTRIETSTLIITCPRVNDNTLLSLTPSHGNIDKDDNDAFDGFDLRLSDSSKRSGQLIGFYSTDKPVSLFAKSYKHDNDQRDSASSSSSSSSGGLTTTGARIHWDHNSMKRRWILDGDKTKISWKDVYVPRLSYITVEVPIDVDIPIASESTQFIDDLTTDCNLNKALYCGIMFQGGSCSLSNTLWKTSLPTRFIMESQFRLSCDPKTLLQYHST